MIFESQSFGFDAAGLGLDGLFSRVREELKKGGVDIEFSGDAEAGAKGRRVKVVVVAPDLKESVDEMAGLSRDHVVMVRVDEQTSKALDAWVTTGAVKSRSEAAALFIREGLKVRANELDALRDALRDVEAAQERLRQKAREVFGDRER